MTSADTEALIEEARGILEPGETGCAECSIGLRLADALEASEAARRDLTDKIEALTAAAKQQLAQWDDEHSAQHLRGLVPGDKARTDG